MSHYGNAPAMLAAHAYTTCQHPCLSASMLTDITHAQHSALIFCICLATRWLSVSNSSAFELRLSSSNLWK